MSDVHRTMSGVARDYLSTTAVLCQSGVSYDHLDPEYLYRLGVSTDQSGHGRSHFGVFPPLHGDR
jgi:hypothetical protein